MNKYQRLQAELEANGHGQMKVFGSSMKPILESGVLLTYQVEEEYRVGDIVLCKVKGRMIDAHKITKVGDDGRFMISNNHGFDNGWTRTIYGRVVVAERNGETKTFWDDRPSKLPPAPESD